MQDLLHCFIEGCFMEEQTESVCVYEKKKSTNFLNPEVALDQRGFNLSRLMKTVIYDQ